MLRRVELAAIARELHGQNGYQLSRAYSAGLQEYIEAITFYTYLSEKRLICKDELQQMFTFEAERDDEQRQELCQFD